MGKSHLNYLKNSVSVIIQRFTGVTVSIMECRLHDLLKNSIVMIDLYNALSFFVRRPIKETSFVYHDKRGFFVFFWAKNRENIAK